MQDSQFPTNRSRSSHQRVLGPCPHCPLSAPSTAYKALCSPGCPLTPSPARWGLAPSPDAFYLVAVILNWPHSFFPLISAMPRVPPPTAPWPHLLLPMPCLPQSLYPGDPDQLRDLNRICPCSPAWTATILHSTRSVLSYILNALCWVPQWKRDDLSILMSAQMCSSLKNKWAQHCGAVS